MRITTSSQQLVITSLEMLFIKLLNCIWNLEATVKAITVPLPVDCNNFFSAACNNFFSAASLNSLDTKSFELLHAHYTRSFGKLLRERQTYSL